MLAIQGVEYFRVDLPPAGHLLGIERDAQVEPRVGRQPCRVEIPDAAPIDGPDVQPLSTSVTGTRLPSAPGVATTRTPTAGVVGKPDATRSVAPTSSRRDSQYRADDAQRNGGDRSRTDTAARSW